MEIDCGMAELLTCAGGEAVLLAELVSTLVKAQLAITLVAQEYMKLLKNNPNFRGDHHTSPTSEPVDAGEDDDDEDEEEEEDEDEDDEKENGKPINNDKAGAENGPADELGGPEENGEPEDDDDEEEGADDPNEEEEDDDDDDDEEDDGGEDEDDEDEEEEEEDEEDVQPPKKRKK